MEDFEDAKDKVYMGLERKSKVIKDEDKKTPLITKAGMPLWPGFCREPMPVNKITINSPRPGRRGHLVFAGGKGFSI